MISAKLPLEKGRKTFGKKQGQSKECKLEPEGGEPRKKPSELLRARKKGKIGKANISLFLPGLLYLGSANTTKRSFASITHILSGILQA